MSFSFNPQVLIVCLVYGMVSWFFAYLFIKANIFFKCIVFILSFAIFRFQTFDYTNFMAIFESVAGEFVFPHSPAFYIIVNPRGELFLLDK